MCMKRLAFSSWFPLSEEIFIVFWQILTFTVKLRKVNDLKRQVVLVLWKCTEIKYSSNWVTALIERKCFEPGLALPEKRTNPAIWEFSRAPARRRRSATMCAIVCVSFLYCEIFEYGKIIQIDWIEKERKKNILQYWKFIEDETGERKILIFAEKEKKNLLRQYFPRSVPRLNKLMKSLWIYHYWIKFFFSLSFLYFLYTSVKKSHI
jgi:hypothetical protein